MRRTRQDGDEGRARGHPLTRLGRLRGPDALALVTALPALVLASLAIRLLPFRRTAMLMTRSARAGRAPADRSRIISRHRWAVDRWADRVPWRTVCFQRGLALHWLLRLRGIDSVLHYGVAQSHEAGLSAHVWIEAGGRIVMGGEEAGKFSRVASFPPAMRG